MQDIKIAYICLCHNYPEFIARLADTLNYQNDKLFIHVDKKVDETPFIESCKNKSNVLFVKERIKNYWGGFNSIIATMNTVKLAMNTDHYDRFILLQGQDYPLFAPKDIHKYFNDHSDIEYCKAKNISISKDKRDYMKCCGFWVQDGSYIRLLRAAFARINKLGIKYRSATFFYKNTKYCIYKGWAQFALTYQCMKYVLDTYMNNSQYNAYMKHRFPPDEIYIHTIIHNSKYKHKISEDIIERRGGEKTLLNLTYFEYPITVTVFTEAEEYDWLKETGCLFVRKVNPSSYQLLDEIDHNIKKSLEDENDESKHNRSGI